jgi:hypothetical protein
LLVLVKSGGFADEKDLGVRRALAWNGFRAIFGQGTSGTRRDLARDLIELCVWLHLMRSSRPARCQIVTQAPEGVQVISPRSVAGEEPTRHFQVKRFG